MRDKLRDTDSLATKERREHKEIVMRRRPFHSSPFAFFVFFCGRPGHYFFVIIVRILLAAVLCLPLHAATIVAEPFPPARFANLYIERDDKGAAVIVQAAGDAVTYKVTLGNKVLEDLTVQPSADDWFKFIQGLNDAKVYAWAPQYYYPGQGPTWVVDFVMDDRNFKSEGTNEYPKNGDESQPAADPKAGPSVPFQLFWQAVLNLVGKVPLPPPPK
jgi:hypothetical protein